MSSRSYPKIWGSTDTSPWHKNSGNDAIGEIWFQASDRVPLLVKILFTSDRLSVQVHPDDDYARKHENSRGKTEMWHVVRAEPAATVAAGLLRPLARDELRDACLSGAIVDLLDWKPARKGDTFYLPAGTIHAIGGGLVLCEVQELSDVTYRLYDYGRPRELHLEKGIDVATLEPAETRAALPVRCGHFVTETLRIEGAAGAAPRPKNTIYVALEGEGVIAGQPFQAGDAFEAEGGADPFGIESPGAYFLITSEP